LGARASDVGAEIFGMERAVNGTLDAIVTTTAAFVGAPPPPRNEDVS